MIEDRIQHAWDLRRAQKIEECLRLVPVLKAEVAGSELDPAQEAELQLLEASLLRVQGKIDRARTKVEETGEYLFKCGVGVHFNLEFERGVTFLLDGSFAEALDHFLRAAVICRASDRDMERKIQALLNAAICMENLQLPMEKTLSEIESAMDERGDVSGVKDQLCALRVRQTFRQGQIDASFASAEKSSPEMNQARYQALWMTALPWHSRFRLADGEALSNLSAAPFFHQKNYRLRTLQGILHPQDINAPRASDFADRIYLWVWMWLRSPKEFPLERILAVLSQTELDQILYRLTAEDRQMLRNALLWLGLFDPASSASLQSLLRRLGQSGLRHDPVFEIEWLLVLWLQAERDGKSLVAKDTLTALRLHKLWNSSEIRFREIVEQIQGKGPSGACTGGESFDGLVGHLRQLLDREDSTFGERLLVDLDRFQIRVTSTGESLISQPIAWALEILRDQETVSCEEFALVCFGIRRYDELIHRAKIMNLLSRIKYLFTSAAVGPLRLGIKSGFVFAHGSWKGLMLVKSEASPLRVRFAPEWKQFIHSGGQSERRNGDLLSTKTSQQSSQNIFVNKVSETLRREELEDLIGKSRATANRQLLMWRKQGLLFKEGGARSTRYRLSEKLQAQLAESGRGFLR
ncbi:MAG: hypothetical protein AABZ06_05945 [Bdellovibrionota bacterium]